MDRVVLHLDMDAFYASIEVRENPTLAGLPVIVGHRGRRGVVTTCSYEARAFGVRSATPSLVAERRCPQAIWIPPRMELYAGVSREVFRILERHSPAVEPLSIDEAFVDLTGIAPDLAHGERVAAGIQAEIRTETKLTASVGIAPNKFLAKVASDLEKPAGRVVLGFEELPGRLWPLPIERLWGVGPRTARQLRDAGWATIGALAQASGAELARILGASSAATLQRLAAGRDDRPVSPERRAKSISAERTYTDDLVDPGDIDRELLARAEHVARELRREQLVGRTVRLKLRVADYTTWTRATTLNEATDLAEPILEAARRMLRDCTPLAGRGLRLLGVGMASLEPAQDRPAQLFEDEATERARRLARATDTIRDRLGEDSVRRARLLDPPRRPDRAR